jgi:hypothetical protein
MADVCEFHRETVAKVDAAGTALEGKVAKSSLKWVAAIFAVPTLAAILSAWAFIASADYRYGSYLQAKTNEAKIQLLEERTMTIKNDLVKHQVDIMNELNEIKRDVKFLTMTSGRSDGK